MLSAQALRASPSAALSPFSAPLDLSAALGALAAATGYQAAPALTAPGFAAPGYGASGVPAPGLGDVSRVSAVAPPPSALAPSGSSTPSPTLPRALRTRGSPERVPGHGVDRGAPHFGGVRRRSSVRDERQTGRRAARPDRTSAKLRAAERRALARRRRGDRAADRCLGERSVSRDRPGVHGSEFRASVSTMPPRSATTSRSCARRSTAGA